MIPVLRRKTRAEQARQIVAIQLLQMKRIDVSARVAVKAFVGRRNHQYAVGREHAREFGQHFRLLRGLEMLDRFE